MAFLLSVGICLGGCDGTAAHPDTGYGLGQPVPSTENCTDFCARLSDCAVHLCDEDKNTTTYLGMSSLLDSECMTGCTDAMLVSKIGSVQWSCLFEKSCRAVLGENVCSVPNASYTCN